MERRLPPRRCTRSLTGERAATTPTSAALRAAGRGAAEHGVRLRRPALAASAAAGTARPPAVCRRPLRRLRPEPRPGRQPRCCGDRLSRARRRARPQADRRRPAAALAVPAAAVHGRGVRRDAPVPVLRRATPTPSWSRRCGGAGPRSSPRFGWAGRAARPAGRGDLRVRSTATLGRRARGPRARCSTCTARSCGCAATHPALLGADPRSARGRRASDEAAGVLGAARDWSAGGGRCAFNFGRVRRALTVAGRGRLAAAARHSPTALRRAGRVGPRDERRDRRAAAARSSCIGGDGCPRPAAYLARDAVPARRDAGTARASNFAIFSEHATAVELCIFDAPDDAEEAHRIELPERTDLVWHGYLPDVRPGQLYGYRVHGPYEPDAGPSLQPAQARCSTPTPRPSRRASAGRRPLRLHGRRPRRPTSSFDDARQRRGDAEVRRRRPGLHLGRRPRARGRRGTAR